jgi:hypothetical protein
VWKWYFGQRPLWKPRTALFSGVEIDFPPRLIGCCKPYKALHPTQVAEQVPGCQAHVGLLYVASWYRKVSQQLDNVTCTNFMFVQVSVIRATENLTERKNIKNHQSIFLSKTQYQPLSIQVGFIIVISIWNEADGIQVLSWEYGGTVRTLSSYLNLIHHPSSQIPLFLKLAKDGKTYDY